MPPFGRFFEENIKETGIIVIIFDRLGGTEIPSAQAWKS